MLKNIIVCIILLVIEARSANFASNFELVLPPNPTSNQLVSLDFIDETTGWAVGEYGTILKSTDAGESWRLIEIPQLNYLTDVYFPTPSTGYIAGKDGMILKSVDGGESWFQQTIRFTNNLHRVRFRDENTGWVIGEKGLILHTRDGGMTWEQQISNCRADLNGLALINDTRICAVGNDSTILMTADNGKNWQHVMFDPDDYQHDFTFEFKDVFFLDDLHGWIGGDFYDTDGIISALFIQTFDGGMTWDEVYTENLRYDEIGGGGSANTPSCGIQQVYYFDLMHGLLLVGYKCGVNSLSGTMSGLPLRTNDGSKNWSSHVLGLSESYRQPGRLCALSSERVINTGFGGEFRISTDGGTQWHYTNQNVRNWENINIGNNGNLIGRQWTWDEEKQDKVRLWKKSGNYGQTWELFQPQFFDSAGALQKNLSLGTPGNYIDDRQKLYTIIGNSVYNSQDGGQNWHWEHSGVTFEKNILPTFFLTSDTLIYYEVFMQEVSNGVYEPWLKFISSFDGGRTMHREIFTEIWNMITPYEPHFGLPKFSAKHFFFNGHTGFIVGSEGNIIKTTNTGRSWENIPSGVVDDLWDITFINRQVGFVVGKYGRILKTEDGGRTWRKTDSGTQEEIFAIGFKNETEGYAGTETGLMVTRDGGETWQRVPLRYFHGKIQKIEFDTDGTGYAYRLKPTDYPYDRFILFRSPDKQPFGYTLLLVLKEGGVAIENTPAISPYQFTLSQNYPNPFNGTTHIRFSLPENASVSLKIYNIQGQLVRTLLDEVRKPGEHAVAWDGATNTGQLAASGVYFVRLIQGEQVRVRKLLLLN